MTSYKEKILDELKETEKGIETMKTFRWYDRDINKLKKQWYKLHERKRILKKLLEEGTGESQKSNGGLQ